MKKPLTFLLLSVLALSGCRASRVEIDIVEPEIGEEEMAELRERVEGMAETEAETAAEAGPASETETETESAAETEAVAEIEAVAETETEAVAEADSDSLPSVALERWISVETPRAHAEFDTVPIVFTGTVSPGAQKIEVIAHREDEGRRDDVYTLKHFEPGDTTFTYRAKEEWNNLWDGWNSYTFNAKFEDGSITSDKVRINYSTPARLSEAVFDGCGKITQYKAKSWYPQFKAAIAKARPGVGDDYGSLEDFKITEENILEACYAANAKVLVFLVDVDYCHEGYVYRYRTHSGDLEKARFEVSNCSGSVREFGARDGEVIPITGRFGDAGYAADVYYDYNFVRNEVELIKSYGYSADAPEEGSWTYY